MTLTLLLDLDDTLLNTNLQAFIPAYFQALSKELAPHAAPDVMLRALLMGTHLMNESDDFSRTLREVFDAEFYAQLNISRGEIEPAIENFYDNVFSNLGSLTTQIPDAKKFVDWAIAKGYRVAIATDPLFPRKATYHRVRWAGFDPEQFEIISSYECFHFSKTHPAYYAEVLGRMGWPEGPVLMAGNDLERDIAPSKKLGLATFHVDVESASSLGKDAQPRGTLSDLIQWLESVDHASLIPSFKTMDSILSLLSATPAALGGLLHGLDAATWHLKTAPEEWSLTELICHLRDTEREIHRMQIELFKEGNEPFIPRPDTSVWASQRDYLHEDGALALKEFVEARQVTVDMLKSIPAEDWDRKARHAIFGPTNFLEVISFFADHDRMHIQQTWSTLRKM
jgi:FMN phosphatase YigB (HAD superfamily)